MGQRAQWPRTRAPIMIPPEVEALGGKTYKQAGQTAGALGGRRSREVWFGSGTVGSIIGKIVKVAGSVWRLVEVSARVRVAPAVGNINVNILAQVPGAGSPVSVFDTLPVIALGQTEASRGVFKADYKLLPVGTLVSMGLTASVSGMMISVYSTVDGKTATLYRVGGAWTKQSEDATAWPTVALHHFSGMGDVLFRCRSNGDNYDGWQMLQRSPDLGVTWEDTTVVGCPDIAQAPNGDLYAIGTGGDSQPHCIYRSTTNGVSWTQVYNDTAGDPTFSVYRRIEVDPADSDHVIAVGWEEGGGTDQVFLRTTDATLGAGATYTRSKPTLTSKAEKNDMAFCFGQSGRLFWAYENYAATQVLVDTSDNDGASWDGRLVHVTSGNRPPMTVFLSGTDIYVLSASSGGILRSPDNGPTWESFTNLPIMTSARALGIDASLGILYAGQNDAPEDDTIKQMQPITVGGSWTDISTNLLIVTGFTNAQLCNEGIVMLVGASAGATDLTTELHYRTQVVAQ